MTKFSRILAGALCASILLPAAQAVACSPDLADDKVGDTYAAVQNGTFLSPPLGDLALDLRNMKLYTLDRKEQWADYLFYIASAAQAGLLTIDAHYDDGTTLSLDDLLAGRLDKARTFVALRVKRTDSGAALSQRTGLADADRAFYFYNGKMVVDGVEGNALKQFG